MPLSRPYRRQIFALLVLCALTSAPQTLSEPVQFEQGNSVLSVYLSDQFSLEMRAELLEWVEHVSEALLQVYERWPRQRWEISLIPVAAPGDRPVPYGQVIRGDVDRVEFYTAQATTADQLKRHWTSYHELSHLLIPYRGWGDLWFSEGLATYYQNVLQARTGIIDEQEMWQKLYDGFMRGRAQTELDGKNLQYLSRNQRQHRAYMRVYWSGTWYFLAADTKLRQLSSAELDLDHALEKLNHCCADRKMSVREMVRKLDTLTGLELFYPLYREAIASTRVPDFESLFQTLGISVNSNHKVRLNPPTPGADMRRQINTPKDL